MSGAVLLLGMFWLSLLITLIWICGVGLGSLLEQSDLRAVRRGRRRAPDVRLGHASAIARAKPEAGSIPATAQLEIDYAANV